MIKNERNGHSIGSLSGGLCVSNERTLRVQRVEQKMPSRWQNGGSRF